MTAADQKVIKDQSNETINPLITAYKWTPIKTSPKNVSESFDANETLQLNIQIQSKGEVTRVTGVDNSIPRNVFKNAEKSILKWKFQAPEELGITEDISRTFTIDLTTEA